MLSLASPVSELPKVGKTIGAKLNKLGIKTVRDLLFYFPFRYDDYSHLTAIKDLVAGQNTTVKARVSLLKTRRSFRQRRLLVEGILEDQSGSLKVIWFNQPWLTKVLKEGEGAYFSGKVSGDLFDLQLINPVFEKTAAQENTNTARIVPIYSVTEQLTIKQLRFWLRSVWPLIDFVDDPMPPAWLKDLQLLPLPEALRQIHFPDSWPRLQLARRRLKFDELFFWQLRGQYLKSQLANFVSPAIAFQLELTKEFIASLPFNLTAEQKKAAWQVIQDLAQPHPTSRLVIGEVGSGKTVIAALAALNCVAEQQQVAVLAPTEILAHQHFLEFNKLFTALPQPQAIKVALLTGQQAVLGGREQKVKRGELLAQLKSGKIDIVIGTHALLVPAVKFRSLGLVVVDEQHRFGVEQRQALKKQKESVPHFLSLSATPIPRSLALAMYADSEVSLISKLPQGRQPIITQIVSVAKQAAAYQLIKEQLRSGRQAYFVCPIIDPSDKLGVKSVKEEFVKLQQQVFVDFRVGLLHGRLSAAEKNQVMQDFVQQKIDLLVSTSVIEVGINVPNATVMAIEGAERFGLAQLHQLRGRVGRGSQQSYCLLLAGEENKESLERLQALTESNDGFALAQKDLQFRGPGELFGLEQSGQWQFKLASLADSELINLAKEQARQVMAQDPELKNHQQFLAEVKNFSTVHLE